MSNLLLASLLLLPQPETRTIALPNAPVSTTPSPVTFEAFSFTPSAVRVTLRSQVTFSVGLEKTSNDSTSRVRYTGGWDLIQGLPSEEDLLGPGHGFVKARVTLGSAQVENRHNLPIIQTPWIGNPYDGQSDFDGSSGWNKRETDDPVTTSVDLDQATNTLWFSGEVYNPGFLSTQGTWPGHFPFMDVQTDLEITITAFP